MRKHPLDDKCQEMFGLTFKQIQQAYQREGRSRQWANELTRNLIWAFSVQERQGPDYLTHALPLWAEKFRKEKTY